MDPNATPWRSLESDPEPASGRPIDPPALAISPVALAAAAGALLLALLAFFLAVGSGGGELVVAGGRPVAPAGVLLRG